MNIFAIYTAIIFPESHRHSNKRINFVIFVNIAKNVIRLNMSFSMLSGLAKKTLAISPGERELTVYILS